MKPLDLLKIDVSVETIQLWRVGSHEPIDSQPSIHRLDWIGIPYRAVKEALDIAAEQEGNAQPGVQAQSLPRPVEPDAAAFVAGATAMRNAIAAAKYDALKDGQLDLSRFELPAVVTAPAQVGQVVVNIHVGSNGTVKA